MAAEAIVSTVLEQLTSIIGKEVVQEVRLVVDVRKEIEKLTSNFRAIKAVLVDAEKRQVETGEETPVGLWLDKLKDASYDMDDVLDEWNTAILELQIVPKKKVCLVFSSPCICFRQIASQHDIGVKIKEINENLHSIAKEKDNYNLNAIRSIKEPKIPKTTAFIEEIYGGEEASLDVSCEKARHSMLILKSSYNVNISGVQKLRSLLIEGEHGYESTSNTFSPGLFERMTCLRSLKLTLGKSQAIISEEEANEKFNDQVNFPSNFEYFWRNENFEITYSVCILSSNNRVDDTMQVLMEQNDSTSTSNKTTAVVGAESSLIIDGINYFVDMLLESRKSKLQGCRGQTTIANVKFLCGGYGAFGFLLSYGFNAMQKNGLGLQPFWGSPFSSMFSCTLIEDKLAVTFKVFVNEVMELVDLNNLKTTIVGLTGIWDVSTEQRKRLTRALKLVIIWDI
ncbi:hypothetical protein EZV62_003777 [Acer yangbiense]|uniref:Disease resistance N-terminal domain-containing protein n=1 Tax=Acer yangbiense TaxID=1000413 RepID=A0A5C7IJL0_9ROSI|nr:hypothetical protein EZV62_003777 [Acer yangbiense]